MERIADHDMNKISLHGATESIQPLESKYRGVERAFLEAMSWLDKNDIAEARKILLEIVSENEQFPNTYCILGWLYWVKFNNDVQAEVYYKKGIEVGSEYVQNYYGYINFLTEKGRTREAKVLIEALEKKGSASACEVAFEYAALYEVEGNVGLAIKYYKDALQKSLNSDGFQKINEAIARCQKKRNAKSWFYSHSFELRFILTVFVLCSWLIMMLVASGHK